MLANSPRIRIVRRSDIQGYGISLANQKGESSPQLIRTAAQLQDKVMVGYGGIPNYGSVNQQYAISIAALDRATRLPQFDTAIDLRSRGRLPHRWHSIFRKEIRLRSANEAGRLAHGQIELQLRPDPACEGSMSICFKCNRSQRAITASLWNRLFSRPSPSFPVH